jgi:outer membrane protein assembly factor BamE (lipoprotein component of BamABCDE complex)
MKLAGIGNSRLGARLGTIVALAGLAAGCSSIQDHRGYISEATLVTSIQPGIDNKTSVEGTLGRPTFKSQFGEETWYYVSSATRQKPFTRPKIRVHGALAVHFDPAGNVSTIETSGIDKVVYLDPAGDKTPTLGKERSFFEDLFGNIGQVGGLGGGAAGGGGGNGP